MAHSTTGRYTATHTSTSPTSSGTVYSVWSKPNSATKGIIENRNPHLKFPSRLSLSIRVVSGNFGPYVGTNVNDFRGRAVDMTQWDTSILENKKSSLQKESTIMWVASHNNILYMTENKLNPPTLGSVSFASHTAPAISPSTFS